MLNEKLAASVSNAAAQPYSTSDQNEKDRPASLGGSAVPDKNTGCVTGETRGNHRTLLLQKHVQIALENEYNNAIQMFDT